MKRAVALIVSPAMKNENKAILLGLTAMLFWATIPTAFKLSLKQVSPDQLLIYSSLTAFIFFFAVVLVTGRFDKVKECTLRQYMLSLVLGFINPCLYYFLLNRVYNILPAQITQPLNMTWTIVMMLLAIVFLRQKMRWFDVTGGIIAYSGVVIISSFGDMSSFKAVDMRGIFMCLATTILWAVYWLINTKDKRDPVVAMFLNFSFALPWLAGLAFFKTGFVIPDGKGLIGAVYVGLFEMGLSFLIWVTALKLTSNVSRIANLVLIAPFLSLVFIRLFVGEVIRSTTFIGLILIVGGIFLQQTLKSRVNQESVPS